MEIPICDGLLFSAFMTIGKSENFKKFSSNYKENGKHIDMTPKMIRVLMNRLCQNGIFKRNLFQRFKIGKSQSFEKHINKYHVVFLNIQDFLGRTDTIYQLKALY